MVRRVALPDAFFAADGLFQTFLTVLEFARTRGDRPELDRYLPFLATTRSWWRRRRASGETARGDPEHAVAAVAMRWGAAGNDLFDRPAATGAWAVPAELTGLADRPGCRRRGKRRGLRGGAVVAAHPDAAA